MVGWARPYRAGMIEFEILQFESALAGTFGGFNEA